VITLRSGCPNQWLVGDAAARVAGRRSATQEDRLRGQGREYGPRFQGWSYVDDLLPQLVTAHPQYARSLESAWAAARHWELVEPQDAPDPAAVMAPVPVVNQMVETSLEVSLLSCCRTSNEHGL